MSAPSTFGRDIAAIFQDVIDLSNSGKEEPIRPAHPGPFLPIYVHPSDWPPELPSGSVTQEFLEDGYQSVVSRTVVEEYLRQWDSETDVTAELGDYLVRIFLPFRGQMLFHIQVPAFLQRVYLPPYSPRAIHPALLYAIFLIACQIGGGRMADFEPVFLARTRAHLYDPVANQDRPTHLIWARIILTGYLARTGKLPEANHTAWLAGKLAAELGLHQGSPRITHSTQANLSHEIECDLPNALWYAASLTTTITATYTGLPSSVPEESLTTLDVLFSPSLHVDYSTNVLILKTKVFTLFRAIRHLTTFQHLTPTPPERESRVAVDYRRHIVAAHAALLNTFPPLDDPAGIEPLETFSPCNPHLTWVYFVYHACTITLYNSLTLTDPHALQKTIDAAYAMSHLCKRLRPCGVLLPIQVPLVVMIPIYCGCETLVVEVHRNRMRQTPGQILLCVRAEEALAVLLDTLLDMSRAYSTRLRGFRKIGTLLGEYQRQGESGSTPEAPVSDLFS